MKKSEYSTVIALFDEYNKNVYKVKALSTYLKYEAVRNYIADYIKQRYGKADYLLSEIDVNFIIGFENYLMKFRKYNVNTAAKKIELFRRIVNIACEKQAISNNPFNHYRIKRQEVVRAFLSEKELQSILSKKFSTKRLEQVRDVFIFSCFTGLNYSDLSMLTAENIETDKDGNPIIKIMRSMTYTPVIIPLLSVPQKILNKYGQNLPIASNQKMNDYLKEIGDVCGIGENLTFRVARNTFATTITYMNGVPIETISRMLGHTNINTTQTLVRMDNGKIGRDMLKLSEHLTSMDTALNL